MKGTVRTCIVIAAIAFLVAGFSQTAAAQIVTGSPSQACKAQIEPIFQELGVPLPHSTCVTLLNGAGPNGDVSVCKWARDLGAIDQNQYGQCVSVRGDLRGIACAWRHRGTIGRIGDFCRNLDKR